MMGKRWRKVKAFHRAWGVRAWTFKRILVVGIGLFCLALFSGKDAIHKVTWAAVSAFLNNPGGYESAFTVTEWTALITPALALGIAWNAHKRDEKRKGKGIKDMILRVVGSEPYNLRTDVIAASMTKQSVLAAIAAVSVAVIQLFPKSSSFGIVVKFLSTFGFAFAILFLLVSMVCYDYASRFHWPPFYKAQLVRKALLLDVFSWYFLLTSFLLSIALINPRLSVLTSVVAGVLMWWYYFFPCERPGLKVKDVVLVRSNNHDGELAHVISFVSTDTEPSYIVKLESSGEKIKVVESELGPAG